MRNKTGLWIISIAGVCLFSSSALAGIYGGGTGVAGDPYQIWDANDLIEMSATSDDWDMHFILMDDVNLTGHVFTQAVIAPDTSSDSDFQGTKFTGVFDGNGRVISNLTIAASGKDFVGLFGSVEPQGTADIKNLTLINSDVNSVSGSYVGSLIGRTINGSISNCHVKDGVISGYNVVGGLIGNDMNGQIINSSSACTVLGNMYIGGLMGGGAYSKISNSYASGNIIGGNDVGGLIGFSGMLIFDSYTTSNVSGVTGVGGLIGHSSFSFVTNSYAAGIVLGDSSIGGFIGDNDENSYAHGDYTECFWDSTVNPALNGIGNGTIDPNIIGKTTTEMQIENTFTDVGWNFVDTWAICEGTNYPRLQWQIPAGDWLCPDGVAFEDYAFLAGHWLLDNCDAGNNDCQGTDLDASGSVDLDDMLLFADNWLQGL